MISRIKYWITQCSLVVALTFLQCVFSIFDPVDHYCNQCEYPNIGSPNFHWLWRWRWRSPQVPCLHQHIHCTHQWCIRVNVSKRKDISVMMLRCVCVELIHILFWHKTELGSISPNIFHFLCKIASIPLCRIEMKTWWHTGNWIGTNFIRYPISDAKCPHLSNPPSRTCWCHATTESDRIKCNRIFSRSLGYRWE